jgi:hypothetical protein
VTAAIIHHHNIQGVLISVRKLMQKDLNVGGIQLRELQEEPLSRGWFDRTVDLEVLEPVLHGTNGLDTAQCHTSTLPRQ